VITSLSTLLSNLISIYFAKKLVPTLGVSWRYLSLGKLRKYFDYGKYLYVIKIAEKIRFSIDDLVIGSLVSVGAITHYAIAATLIRYFGQFMSSVFGVIGPPSHMYHKLGQWDNLREIFLVAAELTLISSILIGGLLITLGQAFILLWVGPEYDDVYPVLLILTTAFIFEQAQLSSFMSLMAIAKHKFYAQITSVEALANLAISIALAKSYGIYGVALGTAIPMLVNKLIMQPGYTCRQLGLPASRYYSILARYLISGVAYFAVVYVVLDYVPVATFPAIIVAGLVISVPFVILNLRYLISGESKKYIQEGVPEQIRYITRLVVR
jgi:O-antigen/teichoic acid export membrane protein